MTGTHNNNAVVGVPWHMSADEAAAPASAAAVERRRRYPLAKVKGGWTADEDLLLKK